MLRLSDHPQLRLIAWNLRDTDSMDDCEAFSLYERNWRFIEQAQLIPSEKALIERLTKEFGHGVMNV